MAETLKPLPMEAFTARRRAAGDLAVCLRLDPLVVELGGLDAELAELLLARYGPHASRGSWDGAALRVRLGLDDTEHFVDPPATTELLRMAIACDGTRVRYISYGVAGWFDTVDGRGDVLLSRGRFEPPERALENFLRAAVAWQAAGRGGALVHAASAVWRDRAYLFYGESGAGKSTLSASNRRARVVSDDLTLVLPAEDGRLEVVGSPFRGTYEEGPPVVGRFPLAAGFRLIQAPRAEVRDVPRLRALAELVGNLPFVAEAFARRPDLLERVEASFAAVPLAHLAFRKDDSYWDAIDSAGY